MPSPSASRHGRARSGVTARGVGLAPYARSPIWPSPIPLRAPAPGAWISRIRSRVPQDPAYPRFGCGPRWRARCRSLRPRRRPGVFHGSGGSGIPAPRLAARPVPRTLAPETTENTFGDLCKMEAASRIDLRTASCLAPSPRSAGGAAALSTSSVQAAEQRAVADLPEPQCECAVCVVAPIRG